MTLPSWEWGLVHYARREKTGKTRRGYIVMKGFVATLGVLAKNYKIKSLKEKRKLAVGPQNIYQCRTVTKTLSLGWTSTGPAAVPGVDPVPLCV